MASDLLLAQTAIRHQETLLGRERAPGRDRIVIPQHDLAARRKERMEWMLADGPRRPGQHVRGRADLEGDAVIDRPGQDGRVVGGPRAVPDPGHAESLDRFDDALGRTRFGRVGGEPETGGRRDREWRSIRGDRGEHELVAGDVEAHDARPGGSGGGPGDRKVRLVVIVPEQADDQAAREAGRGAPIGETLAGGGDDVPDVEPGASVGGRPEAHLEEVAAIGRGILHGLARHAAQGLGRSEDRVRGGHVGEVDRQVPGLVHLQGAVPPATRCRDAGFPGDLGRRGRSDPALEMRVQVQAHGASLLDR